MNVDLVKWALRLLEMAGPVQKKVEDTWPHLKNISNECEAILVIWNNGKALMMQGGPSTAEGSRLVSKLTSAGIDSAEAGQVVARFEAMDSHISK